MSMPAEHDPLRDPPPLPPAESDYQDGTNPDPAPPPLPALEPPPQPTTMYMSARDLPSAPPPPRSNFLPIVLGLLGAGTIAAAGFFPLLQLETAAGTKWPQELPLKEQWIKIAVWVVAGTAGFFTLVRLFVTYWALALGTLATAGATFAFVYLVKPQGGAVQAFLPGLGLYLLAAGGGVLLLGALAHLANRPPRYPY